MVLAEQMQVVYPRNEQLRAEVTPLADEFSKHIKNVGISSDGAAELETADGETYLLNIYEAPIKSQRLRYIITYCPASEIDSWVFEAAVLVLTISSVFVVIVFM